MNKTPEEKINCTNNKNKGFRQYQIRPSFLTLKDEKTVNYHLKRSDYFGTVATLANLLNHLLSSPDRVSKSELKDIIRALDNLEKDSIFLQKKFRIVSKSVPEQKRKRLFQKEDLRANDQKALEKLKELTKTRKRPLFDLDTK